MTIRHMEYWGSTGALWYKSVFNTETGALARLYEDQINSYRPVYSPSPETLDIAITQHCAMACPTCYQDSTMAGQHAPSDLVEHTLKGFTHVPYQVAIGGGEPTTHPDFVAILKSARDLDCVPNFTTSGYVMKPAIFDAANAYCGGVSITYHRHRGIDWFVRHYKAWREAIKRPLNIHVIADKDVVSDLNHLREKLGDQPLSIILLAYSPDVGRGQMAQIMPKPVYNVDLPMTLGFMVDEGHRIAFSEGLLPFFHSRPEIGVDTTFSSRAEGIFSAYVSETGEMRTSSFVSSRDKVMALRQKKYLRDPTDPTVWNASPQKLWEDLYREITPDMKPCLRCSDRWKCLAGSNLHHLTCKKMDHNQ